MECNLLSKLFRGNYYFLQPNYMKWAYTGPGPGPVFHLEWLQLFHCNVLGWSKR